MPEIKPTEVESTASIKVVGVGGAGGSAIDRMKEVGLTGVEFIAINTDAQALHHSVAKTKVIGEFSLNSLYSNHSIRIQSSKLLHNLLLLEF